MKYSNTLIIALFCLAISCTKDKAKTSENTDQNSAIKTEVLNLKENFYKHFEGIIGSLPIKIELTKQGNKLWGSYSFDDFGGNNSFEGTTDNVGNFKLKELTSGILPAVFAGKFITQDSIFGVWINSDKTKQLLLKAKETYKASMAFDAYFMADTLRLSSHPEGPYASFNLLYFYPTGVKDSILSKWKELSLKVFQKDTISEDITKKIEFAKHDFFANFKSYIKQTDSVGITSQFMDFERKAGCDILLNEKNIVTIQTNTFEKAGGAHGISNTFYLVFDILDQKAVRLQDIFVDNYQALLSRKISDIVLNDFKTNDPATNGTKLTDFGFFTDTISPNQNFYLTKNGLGFTYNEYEIAPFTLGKIKLFFPFKDIATIIRLNSCLARLIEKDK